MKIADAKSLLHIDANPPATLRIEQGQTLGGRLHEVPFDPRWQMLVLSEYARLHGLHQTDHIVHPTALQDAMIADAIVNPDMRRPAPYAMAQLRNEAGYLYSELENIGGMLMRSKEDIVAARPYDYEVDERYKRYDTLHFAMLKFVLLRKIAGKAIDQFIMHPGKDIEPSVHIRHERTAVIELAGAMSLHRTLIDRSRHGNERAKRQSRLFGGLLQELDVFMGLTCLFQAKKIGVLILPASWQLERTRYVDGQKQDGLDYVLVRPSTREIWGVQTGLTKTKTESEGIITIDAGMIGNTEGHRIVAGHVTGTIGLRYGEPDPLVSKMDDNGSVIDMSTPAHRARSKSDGEKAIKGIRRDFERILKEQAPEILDSAA